MELDEIEGGIERSGLRTTLRRDRRSKRPAQQEVAGLKAGECAEEPGDTLSTTRPELRRARPDRMRRDQQAGQSSETYPVGTCHPKRMAPNAGIVEVSGGTARGRFKSGTDHPAQGAKDGTQRSLLIHPTLSFETVASSSSPRPPTLSHEQAECVVVRSS